MNMKILVAFIFHRLVEIKCIVILRRFTQQNNNNNNIEKYVIQHFDRLLYRVYRKLSDINDAYF